MSAVLPKAGWRKLSAWAMVFGLVTWAVHTGRPIGETEAELLWRTMILFFGVNGMEHVTGWIAAWKGKS